MRARATIVGVLLLVVLLVAACGSNTPSAEKTMNAKFDKIDYSMASMETVNAGFGPQLQQATERYIALVRQYKSLLGSDEAKHRLVAKGDEVSDYCLACAATLYDAAKKYD
jgi:outer membrane lipoprotein-sorting protein